jgi:hypothetical protein
LRWSLGVGRSWQKLVKAGKYPIRISSKPNQKVQLIVLLAKCNDIAYFIINNDTKLFLFIIFAAYFSAD